MGEISRFLERDHDRLDGLFKKALGAGERVDLAAYEAFRRGLLKHVGMEELILIPAAKRLKGGAISLARQARLEHAALTSLLIPNPTTLILKALRAVLAPHNEMEERADGLYDECERVLGREAGPLLERLQGAPDIPPAAHVDDPRVDASIKAALEAAGHGGVAFR